MSREVDLKVFISVDMEGISGIVDRNQTGIDEADYQSGRALMVGDVNASIEGIMEGSFLRFDVKDTGIGISAENLSQIFDDFYRTDDDRIKKIPGTGLGLTIAKKIVNSHFGRIEVESQLEKGSTFSVFLPLEHRK